MSTEETYLCADEEETTSITSSCSFIFVLLDFFQYSIGWTPELRDKINNVKCGEGEDSSCSITEWSYAILYSFVFLVDFADAVFDLILAFQTCQQYEGEDHHGMKRLGILLGVMTLLGRFITGMYVYTYGRYTEKYGKDVIAYLMMEFTVFMLEDGAAMLLLAKTGTITSMNMIQICSLTLTLICALAYILVMFGWLFLYVGLRMFYFLTVVRCISGDFTCYCFKKSIFRVAAASPIFLIGILVNQVFIKTSEEEDDHSLSGGLELASYIVYGTGAFIILSYFILWRRP